MIDHLGIEVADYARSRAFYTRVLAPLGHGVVMEVTREMSGGYAGCGFGPPHRPHFWVGKGSGVSAGRLGDSLGGSVGGASEGVSLTMSGL